MGTTATSETCLRASKSYPQKNEYKPDGLLFELVAARVFQANLQSAKHEGKNLVA